MVGFNGHAQIGLLARILQPLAHHHQIVLAVQKPQFFSNDSLEKR
jgi:hypothetical protein